MLARYARNSFTFTFPSFAAKKKKFLAQLFNNKQKVHFFSGRVYSKLAVIITV